MPEIEMRDYATDWDNTLIPYDSGFRLMQNAADYDGGFQYVPQGADYEDLPTADEFGQQQFETLINAVNEEKPRGHSNPLVTFLYNNPEFAEHAEQRIDKLNLENRQGFEGFLQYRAEQDAPNILSTAGYFPVAQAQTNGHFDGIIAGDFDHRPFYNGQGEKGHNLENFYDEELGREPYELVYTGDSNGDIEAIRFADRNGGFGVAVGPSIQQARQNVDEATVYVADPGIEHHTTGWVLNRLTMPDNPAPVQELAERGLEIPEGKVVAGELAGEEKEAEINDVKQYLEGVIQSLE